MEENRNRHLRPRRNVEEITGQASAPVQNQSAPQNVPVQPTQKPSATPVQRPAPVQNQSAPQNVPVQPTQRPSATPVQRPAPVQNQSAPQNVPVQPTQKPSATPVQRPAPMPRPTPVKKDVSDLEKSRVFDITTAPSFADADNEQTRLTDVQEKADFKTPIRKKDDGEGKKASALGGVLKALIYMVSVVLVSVVLAYFAIQFANDVFAFVKSDEAVEVVIPKDATVDDVANILGKSEVIKYPFLFKIYASLMDEDGVDENGESVFLPGTYEVSPMKNYMQLLAYFQAQSRPREVVWVTFPEGSTVEEMITVLVDDYGIASREEFKRAINEYDYELEFLEGLDSLEGRYYRLEGYLFPDTYQFYSDSTAETVVYKMLVNFGDKLNYLSYGETTYKDRLAELGMTLDEVVTLASIIEEEVKYPIDYDQVSSVFHNRLADPAKYPQLGSDATTVYAITMETGTRPETLGAAELAFDSPYNTRKSSGLTPGAIANPGFEALYSAFYPADTKYYYFVADNNGYNLYAKTEAGHEKNKASIKNDK